MNEFRNRNQNYDEVTDERMEERIKNRLKQRRRRKNRTLALYILTCSSVIIVILIAVIIGIGTFSKQTAGGTQNGSESSEINSLRESQTDSESTQVVGKNEQPVWDEQLLTPNEYSRPQDKLSEVTGIVVHYVGNANTTAKQNRDYFEDLATTHATSASSHFVVGLDGEIILCVPLDEIAYATRHRNVDTISIEVCHPDESGKFGPKTYDALVELVTWLMVEYDLSTEEVIRHYDVTGKECPKYFVDHESAWEDFKSDLDEYIDKNSEIRTK